MGAMSGSAQNSANSCATAEMGDIMLKFRSMLAAIGLALLIGSAATAASYSALTSMETQVAKAANTPYPIVMTGDSSKAFKIDGARLIAQREGDYYFNAAAQVGATGSQGGDVYLWLRLNGKDVEDSNSVQSVPTPSFTAVLVSQGGMTLKKGDVLEFVYAATAPGLGLVATKPANMPGVPSIIFSMFEL